MTRTFRITKCYTSGDNNLLFQLDKSSRVPESLFWTLVEDQLRLLLLDAPEQYEAGMARIKSHLEQKKRENAITVHHLTFTLITRK